MIRSESPTSMGRNETPFTSSPMVHMPSEILEEQGEAGPPQLRTNTSPPAGPIGRFKKLMKSKPSFPGTIQSESREMAHMRSEGFSLF